MALGAVQTVAFANGSACQFRPWFLFEDCAAALQDEDNLAAVIVGVHSDSGTGDEPPLEYTVASTSQMLNPVTGDLDSDILLPVIRHYNLHQESR